MVFCFENFDIDSLIDEYNDILSTNDIVVLKKSVCGRVNLPYELNGKTQLIKRLLLFSRQKEIILFVAMDAQIGGNIYDSIMVIDKGKVLGVSDCICEQKGYKSGTSLRSYATSMGKVCVFAGQDIMYAELWSHVVGCRYIINICDSAYDGLHIACSRAVASYAGKYVLVVFADNVVCITPYGKIESIKQGHMTTFYLPMSLARGNRFNKKIKFVQEDGEDI